MLNNVAVKNLYTFTIMCCSDPWVSRGRLHQGAEEERSCVSACPLCEYFTQRRLKPGSRVSLFRSLTHRVNSWHHQEQCRPWKEDNINKVFLNKRQLTSSSTLSPGYLHVLRSGHRLWWLLCPLSWENIWGEETVSGSLLMKRSLFNSSSVNFFFLSFRTCSSVRTWPGPHSWPQEALLQSFSPLSLVSSLASRAN